ncbi:MAG: type VI secretion system tube protein Hcp [Pseudomonadota bacterium]
MLMKFIAAGVASAAFTLTASADIYLKLEGEIAGSATEKGYEQWIELTSFGEGTSRPVSSSTSARDVSRPIGSNVEATKMLDTASVDLRMALLQGQVFPSAEIVVTSTGPRGETMAMYTVKMKNVRVASMSASSDGDMVEENLSLAFQTIGWATNTPDARGGITSKPMKGWNFQSNRAETP